MPSPSESSPVPKHRVEKSWITASLRGNARMPQAVMSIGIDLACEILAKESSLEKFLSSKMSRFQAEDFARAANRLHASHNITHQDGNPRDISISAAETLWEAEKSVVLIFIIWATQPSFFREANKDAAGSLLFDRITGLPSFGAIIKEIKNNETFHSLLIAKAKTIIKNKQDRKKLQKFFALMKGIIHTPEDSILEAELEAYKTILLPRVAKTNKDHPERARMIRILDRSILSIYESFLSHITHRILGDEKNRAKYERYLSNFKPLFSQPL